VLQYGIKVLSDITQQVVGGVTNWYQSPVYNTEPGWAEVNIMSKQFSQRIEFGSG
jgi:hypothetical protein